MKFTLTLLFLIFFVPLFAQVKVAILDFENTSGISKYDGFGKALSNMLITDLKNSIHPRKVTFLERSQLNKVLSEQNLQKSKNFDKSTAVSFGKLAGVKYVLVGSVYVMEGTCNITSRLVDVQTSEIVHAKESNGSISKWLSLKTILAQELSNAMNNPVTIEAEFTNKETSEGIITQYAKIIDKIDQGDVSGAQEMSEMLASVQPDFKYFEEIQLDIEELKKQVEENKKRISVVETDVKTLSDALLNSENVYFPNPVNKLQFLSNATLDKKNGKYQSAINNYLKYFSPDDKVFDPYMEFLEIISLSELTEEREDYLTRTRNSENLFDKILNILLINDEEKRIELFKNLHLAQNANPLIRYYYLKSLLDKNISYAPLDCKKLDEYELINVQFNEKNFENSLKEYFIDKIKIDEEFDSYLKKSRWPQDFVNNALEALYKFDVGGDIYIQNLGTITNCSNTKIKSLVEEFMKKKGKFVNKNSLLGTFYRHDGSRFLTNEFIEIRSQRKLVWHNDEANNQVFDCEYSVTGKNISLEIQGIPFNLKIEDSSTLIYIDPFDGSKFEFRRKANQIESVKTNVNSNSSDIKIGKQTWMGANLNAVVFRNGDTITYAKNNKEWLILCENKKPAWCHFNHNPDNDLNYGKIYNWYAVSDERGLAPVGYRVPSKDDFERLMSKSGGSKSGSKLKRINSWSKSEYNSNRLGFSAIPIGYRYANLNQNDSGFIDGDACLFWTSTETSIEKANYFSIEGFSDSDYFDNLRFGQFDKSYGLSLRCIKK